jgi:hypothetical protein
MNAIVRNPDAYRADEYFAFIDDEEELDAQLLEGPAEHWWSAIAQARRQRDLPPPSKLFWLDCVSARYFEALPWRLEICDVGNVSNSARRREQIGALDASQFIIVPLFLSSGPDERFISTQFAESDWHRVVVAEEKGLPVLSAPDYDFELGIGVLRYLRYAAECTEGERVSLRNVFNLNFLPDAEIGREGEGNRQVPPQNPSRGGGAKLRHRTNEDYLIR